MAIIKVLWWSFRLFIFAVSASAYIGFGWPSVLLMANIPSTVWLVLSVLVALSLAWDARGWREYLRHRKPQPANPRFFDFSGYAAMKHLQFDSRFANGCANWDDFYRRAGPELAGRLRLGELRVAGIPRTYDVPIEIKDLTIWDAGTLNLYTFHTPSDSFQTYDVDYDFSSPDGRQRIVRTNFRELTFNRDQFVAHWPSVGLLGKFRNRWVLSIPGRDDERSVICKLRTWHHKAQTGLPRYLGHRKARGRVRAREIWRKSTKRVANLRESIRDKWRRHVARKVP